MQQGLRANVYQSSRQTSIQLQKYTKFLEYSIVFSCVLKFNNFVAIA